MPPAHQRLEADDFAADSGLRLILERELVAFHRGLHVQEEKDAEASIRAEGCEIVELDNAQRDAFAKTVQPIYAEARKQLGDELFRLTGL